MRVLVTFAVDAEFAPWRKLRSFAKSEANGFTLWNATVGTADVLVLLTGIGSSAAARVMGLMMSGVAKDNYLDVCLSSGLAGALRTVHRAGDILAPEFLKSQRVHADLGSDSIVTDRGLRELAVSRGAKVVECFYTAKHVFTTVQEKAALADKADAVDMESFDILKEASAWGARGVAIRAISDLADEDLPIDFNRTVSPDHQVSIRKVIKELAKKPQAIGSLIRFGKQSRQSAESLAAFLDGYVQALSQSSALGRAVEAAAR